MRNFIRRIFGRSINQKKVDNVEKLIIDLNDGKISNIKDIYRTLLVSNEEEITQIMDMLRYQLSPTEIDKYGKSLKILTYGPNIVTRGKINVITDLNIDSRDIVDLIGLASFHYNGYTREKALKIMSKYHTGNELKYFIIRTNDWVEVIRNYATVLTLDRIHQDNIEEIYNNVPLITKFTKYVSGLRLIISPGRRSRRYEVIFERVVKLFSLKDNKKWVTKGVQSNIRSVKVFFYAILQESSFFSIEEKITYLKNEKDTVLRKANIQSLLEGLDREILKNIYPTILKDKFGPIRNVILTEVCEKKVIGYEKLLYKYLSDECKSIRETSRFFLSNVKTIDYREVYVQNLNQSIDIIGSIFGLGETGTKHDTDFLLGFMNHSIRATKACLYSISKLNHEDNGNLFLEFLNNKSKGIAKTSYKMIESNMDCYSINSLRNVYVSTRYYYVKMYVARLLSTYSKWDALENLLWMLRQDGRIIYDVVTPRILKWISGYNKSFTKPSKNQIMRTNNLINQLYDENLFEEYIYNELKLLLVPLIEVS